MEGAVSRDRPGAARTQSPQAPGCKQYLEDVLHKLQALVAPGHDLAEEQQAATRALFADFISGCLQMYFLHGGGTGLLAAPPWPDPAAPDPHPAKERPPQERERPWYLSDVAAAPKPAETSRAIAPAYHAAALDAPARHAAGYPEPAHSPRPYPLQPPRPAPVPALFERANDLTEREKEVLQWIAEGRTSREVGLILSIAERTVKFHLRNIYSKLNVLNRTQAVSIANRMNLG
ncbi:DNA-binding transcriptional regulator, CsgD family [Lysobacter sp. yr284]|uniref:helix-turn-helix domain-containing protein n=1 Tax=Lysobacter sp. yr284 TaxID=1761791 RepID=UPI000898975F|nr:helix-turn-helix transcriptional regulator [Lysobacter sp. yr284]SDY92498.1 DNA-binding transcriptional regulator, CsgD family [Lysobacter sp. yr284]